MNGHEKRALIDPGVAPCSALTAADMTDIEIYIGERIAHGSDRAVLLHAFSTLKVQSVPGALLTNLHIGNRQIDLIVATQSRVLVVEGKAWRVAVRGAENGPWQIRTASAKWKEAPNGYQQALGAKNALRDAMQAFTTGLVPYPDAALIFCPHVPSGSELPAGDFKVAIGGLALLATMAVGKGEQGWSLEQWKSFARHLRLTQASSLEAAIDPSLFDAENRLAAYGTQFQACYQPFVESFVEIPCSFGESKEILSPEQVLARVGDEPGLLISGPSGCGKTLLGYRLALAALDRGAVPFVISAKNYEGDFAETADIEAVFLGAPTARAIIAASRRLNRQLVFVIDGYNECQADHHFRLTRSISALARRFDARLIVSSQTTIERPDLLGLRDLVVSRPDRGIKSAIAMRVAGATLTQSVHDLLASVDTGLEASLIGVIGPSLPADASRFAVFEHYVRIRLGNEATFGIALLSRIAGLMLDQTRFSISNRDLDRLVDREHISAAMLNAVKASNLINIRGGRVSLRHELFTYFFMSEAIVRRADGKTEALQSALRDPRHAQYRAFLLGAIADDRTIRILSSCTDTALIRDCLRGYCGKTARSWAERKCENVLTRAKQETEQLAFELAEKAHLEVDICQNTIFNWSEQDKAILAAIPEQLLKGDFLDQVLDVLGVADAVLVREHKRLLEAARAKGVALRTGLFNAAYVKHRLDAAAITQIVDPVRRGMLYRAPEGRDGIALRVRIEDGPLSDGQLFLLLQLNRHIRNPATPFADLLPGLLRERWRFAPYHLRNQLIESIQWAGFGASQNERADLIVALEELLPLSNPLLSTGVIDALKTLGALESEEESHVAVVRANVAEALGDPGSPELQQLARSLWFSQFDHPFDGAYCQVWNEFEDGQRKTLLVMAAKATEADSWLFGVLVASLASFNDVALAPLISRWIALPDAHSVHPSEAIQTFAVAHAALARLKAALPARSQHLTPAGRALAACGELVYWLNRADLEHAERRLACKGPVEVLTLHEGGVAASAINEFRFSNGLFQETVQGIPGKEPVVSNFVREFPDVITEVFRSALRKPTEQQGYFRHFRLTDLLSSCLAALGELGSVQDIDLMRPYTLVPDLGTVAIDSIRRIEGIQGEPLNMIAR